MRRVAPVALAAVALAAAAPPAGAAEPIRVFAASSLTEAFTEIAAAFEQERPGEKVELNVAGSQVLRTQIEQGARADVFASADLVHADALTSAGLLGRTTVFTRNRLVVVVPADHPRVTRLADVARPGVKVLLAGPTVPVGRYAAEVLGKLGKAGAYGDDFARRVRANVVSEETNVRAVLSKVALGEADAGFVYLTDAATVGDKVRTLEVPEPYNVIALYPIGVVTASAGRAEAQAFVDLVQGPAGQAILARYGFTR